MATFNGLSIKMKRKIMYAGFEAPLANGEFYLNRDGKAVLIGTYCDDAHGVSLNVNIKPEYNDVFWAIVDAYQGKDAGTREECLVWDLEGVTLCERSFIKDRKKYPSCIYISFDSAYVDGVYHDACDVRCWEKHVAQILAEHPHQRSRIFRTPEDFNIVF